MSLPSDRRIAIVRNEFKRQLIAIKKSVHWSDFNVGGDCADPDSSEPGFLTVTFGANAELTDWNYQTGDNSYSGGAYGFPYWGLCYIRPRTNSREAAKEAMDDILEQIAQSQP